MSSHCSVPLLPGLVISRVEKASTASTKTVTAADLNQDEDLAFICKQNWLYNISVYIYLFLSGDLIPAWSKLGMELEFWFVGIMLFSQVLVQMVAHCKIPNEKTQKGKGVEHIISLLAQSTRRLFLDSTSHSASCP